MIIIIKLFILAVIEFTMSRFNFFFISASHITKINLVTIDESQHIKI